MKLNWYKGNSYAGARILGTYLTLQVEPDKDGCWRWQRYESTGWNKINETPWKGGYATMDEACDAAESYGRRKD